jgi:hypothetical protein
MDMNDFLFWFIDTFFGAWSNSEWLGRVIGFSLIFFTVLVFGWNILVYLADVSASMWSLFFASLTLTWAFLHFVRPPV